MKPPRPVTVIFRPWYRSVIWAVAIAATVTMVVVGTRDGAPTGPALWAWVPLMGMVFLGARWQRQAERAWKREHPSG